MLKGLALSGVVAVAGAIAVGGSDAAAEASCPVQGTSGRFVLSAGFSRGRSPTLATTYGDSAVVSGSLESDGGEPLAGATLCVEEVLIGAGLSAGERIPVPHLGFARTDGAGRYLYRVPAGPNREVDVLYRDQAGETSQAVRFFSTARPTLQANPRRTRNHGRPVLFRGKLPGPLARGRVVVLQAWAGPDHWLTFRQATTDAAGRFRTRYRFNRTRQSITYTFRALVPRQAGYPWLSGASRWVRVRVDAGSMKERAAGAAGGDTSRS